MATHVERDQQLEGAAERARLAFMSSGGDVDATQSNFKVKKRPATLPKPKRTTPTETKPEEQEKNDPETPTTEAAKEEEAPNKGEEAINKQEKEATEAMSTPPMSPVFGRTKSFKPPKVLNEAEINSRLSLRQSSSTDCCQVCNKAAYAMEKIEADGMVFHKHCFKCSVCKKTIGLGNYAAVEGKMFCKPHFKQLFKLKGNYDEGFGTSQRKKDWNTESDVLPADAAVSG
eukprot:m.14769 g.14769  ORF g.14769 m.14769 type:complete len:230 (-) comp5200_c0_seq1:1681-2370(-)